MGKKLVIVESPTKAKTIGRYLGKDYKISASVGHIRDLPRNSMGVNVNDNFKPIYITTNVKVVKELRELASDADFVYIATDPDREGEAIAWHVAHVLKIDPSTNCRITFNEITKKAVQEAISNPRSIDMDLVDAQQARRILDRLVGYELSPLLCSKIRRGLSAGRVQSVATKIVMDRDAQIDAFIPEDYWLVSSIVKPEGNNTKFKVSYYGTNVDGKVEKPKNGRILTEEKAKSVVDHVKGNDLKIISVKKGEGTRKPAPPFTTSTMQQEASRRLGFSTKKTTSLAQQLYEGIEIAGHGQTALVSYIRTDSVRVSDEAVAFSRTLIEEKFGKEYVCPYKRNYKNKNSAQDAHEAIRPTHFDLNPELIKSSLSNDQYKLYKLIWERFLASQMADAAIDTVTMEAECNNEIFRAQGETVAFAGFLAVYADIKEENEEDNEKENKSKLPELSEGQTLKNLDLTCDKKQTLPPPHYTEATLIKAMEDNGIGRPSTYSATISTILDRKYVDREGRNLHITELGKLVTNMLEDNFNQIVDVSFTAAMEEKLDTVETGNANWVKVLSEFYPGFHEQVQNASDSIEKVKIESEKIGEKCPECGDGDLVIKEGRNGKFIACSCFPKCTYTRNIEVQAKGKCPVCGSGLLVRKTRKGSKTFYVCDKKGTKPDCDFISWDLPIDDKKCETCGSYMVWHRFRGKVYPKCSNQDCETNKKKKKSDKDPSDE